MFDGVIGVIVEQQLIYKKRVARLRELIKKQSELKDKVSQNTATLNSMQEHIKADEDLLLGMKVEITGLLKDLGLYEGGQFFELALTAFMAEMIGQEGD